MTFHQYPVEVVQRMITDVMCYRTPADKVPFHLATVPLYVLKWKDRGTGLELVRDSIFIPYKLINWIMSIDSARPNLKDNYNDPSMQGIRVLLHQ